MTKIFSRVFRTLLWTLAGFGVLAVAIVAMIAMPLVQPPELASISAARKNVDFSALPALSRFPARDGTSLAYRHYPATGAEPVAIVIHGSTGSSASTIHALSSALAAKGVQTYAVDIRGHGGSGTRGDIGYLGQLEDDLADLVGEIRKTNPDAPLTLIGHSSGGGFALRVAASDIQNLFARTVLLAPYLGYDAPSNRPNSGGWASPDIPRFIGLSLLRELGMPWAESLPTLAFAVPAASSGRSTSTYSYRLMRNFSASQDFRADAKTGIRRDFRSDLAAATRPLAIFAGADDELMFAEQYPKVAGDRAMVRLFDGVNHMGIVADPAAINVIADDVAHAGAAS